MRNPAAVSFPESVPVVLEEPTRQPIRQSQPSPRCTALPEAGVSRGVSVVPVLTVLCRKILEMAAAVGAIVEHTGIPVPVT